MDLKTFAEFHLKGIRALDEKQMDRLLPALRQAELSIRRSLDRLPPQSYSYRRRRATSILLRQSIFEMENILMAEADRAGRESFERGVYNANREILEFNREAAVPFLNVNKQRVAIEKENFLINNAKESLRTYPARERAKISDAITQSVLSEESGHTGAVRISRFVASGIDKAKLIFRTEQHKILNQAKLETYKKFNEKYFPDLKKALFHPMDHRTADDSKHLKALGPVIPLNKPFEYKWRGKKRIFMTPPDRPNDRATIIPIRPEWRVTK